MMNSEELRALQAPLKEKYREDPNSAVVILHSEGRIAEGIACKVETGRAVLEAGLHPATGGDGSQLCSGDMLLEALVACAGVTLQAVATAINIPLEDARISANGELDFCGTLGVFKEAQVGFRSIRLCFELKSDAPKSSLDKLIELTERYCVVLQTIKQPPEVFVSRNFLT